MTVLAWSDQLALGHAEMDATHQEFVALLNAFGAAEGEAILPPLDAFIAHTEAHFAQEEAWMEAKRFPPLGCNRAEHANILEVVREVRGRIAGGEHEYGRRLAEALAEWFQVHACGKDAMLALFLENPDVFRNTGSCGDPEHVCEHHAAEGAVGG